MKYSTYLDYKLSRVQYAQLSKTCDKIIHRNLLNKAVVAQDFLHVSRYSPLMSKVYTGIYTVNLLSFFFQIFRNVIYFGKNILNSFTYRELNLSIYDEKIDYLFISHYTGNQNNLEYVDSYFGEVIKKININGVKVVVAYINHTSYKSINVCSNQIDSILLDRKINFFKLIQIYKESLFALLKFKSIGNNTISKRLSIKAQIGLFSPGTISTQIIAYHIQTLVSKLSPKNLVTTYEGHAWERLCFSLAREVNPLIKCIAYQHAPIFKYQHAIKRNIGGNYDPDIILASGIVSESQLLSFEQLRNSNVYLLGSGRFAPIVPNPNQFSSSVDTCLVAPEGTILECLILFGFALECAKRLDNISFIWRFPPQVDIQILKKSDVKFKNLEENISISKVSLESDIKTSSYILYRGSSVVIQAVLLGLKPIYFMQYNELSMDPLFDCQGSERIVKNVVDFENKIQDEWLVSDELITHCKEMYTEINLKVLEDVPA